MGFAVIIPTKDRPQLLQAAIGSVLSQSVQPDEVIVVDDGSSADTLAVIRSLVAAAGPHVRMIELVSVPGGHGPAYSRNTGVLASHSSHLCFLDDDDTWIDNDYLASIANSLVLEADPFDLHFFNQRAFDGEREVLQSIWIAELKDIVRNRQAGTGGTYKVSIQDLLRCTGFCHLNTTCVRREFFDTIGGFNDEIRYESDRDFFFRAIDRAHCMKYTPRHIARHNIPNPTVGVNVSTSFSQYNRWLIQLRIVEDLSLKAQHSEIRAYGRRYRAYTLKRIAKSLYDDRQYRRAMSHAKMGLLAGFTLRWAIFTVWATAMAFWIEPIRSTRRQPALRTTQ